MQSIKIINRSSNPLPHYATAGSAGMDLKANLEEAVTLKHDENMLVPTGIHLELIEGYEAQIRPRSGLSKRRILVFFGTVDSDYRGEIFVSLMNISGEDFTIQPGDRIAQMVIAQYERGNWIPVEEISDSVIGYWQWYCY